MSANLIGSSPSEQARQKHELISANTISSQISASDQTTGQSEAKDGQQVCVSVAGSDHVYLPEPDFARIESRIRTKSRLGTAFFMITGFILCIMFQSSRLSEYIDRIVVKQLPNSAKAHAALARDLAYSDEKLRQNEAISEWDKAIALDQNNPEYYSDRADVYDEKGEFQKSFDDNSKAIGLQHDKELLAWYHSARARAASHLGLWQVCARDCDEVIATDPRSTKIDIYEDPNIHELKASSLEHIGKAKEALQEYTRSLDLTCPSQRHNSLLVRGNFFARQHDYERALSDYNTCLDGGYYPECLVARGRLLAKLGQNEKALTDFNQAVRYDPNVGTAYFYRSKLLRQLGKNAEAEADEKALKELPSWSPPGDDDWR